MEFTDEESKWIDICKRFPSRYAIMVDNDDVFIIDRTIDENYGKSPCVFTFSNFGEIFMVGLLLKLGITASFV